LGKREKRNIHPLANTHSFTLFRRDFMLSKATVPLKEPRLQKPVTCPGSLKPEPSETKKWPWPPQKVRPIVNVHGPEQSVALAKDQDQRQRWLTVTRMASEYREVITEAALRSLIWNAEAHARAPRSGLTSNGFLPVIVRPPLQRKILLDRIEFEKWLTTNQVSGNSK
jgi:hypothetical protein